MNALRQLRIVLALLIFVGSGISAATWELPEGTVPGDVAPAALPEGMVGAITFEEVEFPEGTVIDGLVVTTLDGAPLPAPLSFGFTSIDAIVTISGPGDVTYVQPPNIEGDATGTLTIDFGLDTTSMTFGFALACVGPIVDGSTAQALDAQNSPVGSPVSVDATDLGGGFAENQLNLSPGGAFRSVEITFYPGDDCGRYALDNLAYGSQPVPTLPAATFVALALLLMGAGLFAFYLRRA